MNMSTRSRVPLSSRKPSPLRATTKPWRSCRTLTLIHRRPWSSRSLRRRRPVTNYKLQITNYVLRFTNYAPEHIEMEVKTDGDGYLVLTDAWYPDWTATIDGEPVEILRANVYFR